MEGTAVHTVLGFDAGHLVNLDSLHHFCVAVQDALADMKGDMTAVKAGMEETRTEVVGARENMEGVQRSLADMQEATGPNLWKVIASLRDEVVRVNKGREKAASAALAALYPCIRARYYRTWLRWAKRFSRRKQTWWLLRHSAKRLASGFFGKLRTHAVVCRLRRRNLRSLMLSTVTKLARLRFRQLLAFSQTSARHSGVRHTRVVSRALLLNCVKRQAGRYFDKWVRWLRAIGEWKTKRRRNLEKSRLLDTATNRSTVGKWYRRWEVLAIRARSQRERDGVVARVVEVARRAEEAVAGVKANFGAVEQKCEFLGSQVDVSLTSLSNTNNVLNTMVDRMLTVDKHLEVLHNEKVSRSEFYGPCSRRGSDDAFSQRRRLSPPRPKPSKSAGVEIYQDHGMDHQPPFDFRSHSNSATASRGRANSWFPTDAPVQSPEKALVKQRTTFMGHNGVITAADALIEVPSIQNPQQVAATGKRQPLGSVQGQHELDHILKRLDDRSHMLSSSRASSPYAPSSLHEQRRGSPSVPHDLDSLRVLELERKLGITQQQQQQQKAFGGFSS